MPGMMQDDGLKCPRCQSDKINKNGRKNGKQRFLCKDCRRQFVKAETKRGYDDAFKTICLQAYRNGKSFREIERVYDVHHTTVISWVKQAGFDLSELVKSNPDASSSSKRFEPYQHHQAELTAAEIRERSLSSALHLFTKQGYDATKMDQIAALADLPVQTLMAYFEDEESIFAALIRYLLDETYWALFRFSTGEPVAPDTALRQVATTLLDSFLNDPALIMLIRLVVGESGRFPELAKRFVREVEKPVFEQLSTYFKFHPDVQIGDPAVATSIFVGTLMHYSLVQTVLQGEEILPMRRDRLITGLIAGIMTADSQCNHLSQ